MNPKHKEVDMEVRGVMKEDIMTDKELNTHSQRHGGDRSYEGRHHDRQRTKHPLSERHGGERSYEGRHHDRQRTKHPLSETWR